MGLSVEGVLVWSREQAWAPLLDSDARAWPVLKRRIGRRLGLDLPAVLRAAEACYLSQWTGDELGVGFIVRDMSETALPHLQVLLARFTGLLGYFCGTPLNDETVAAKAAFIIELFGVVTRMPLLAAVEISCGELVQHVRRSISRDNQRHCQPANRRLEIGVIETLHSVLSLADPARSRSVLHGRVAVNNPLAHDLVLRASTRIPLVPAAHVRAFTETIPLELGLYTLGAYEVADRLPFDVRVSSEGRDVTLSLLWRSGSVGDDLRVNRCRLTLRLAPGPVPVLARDPPTLAHRASADSRAQTVHWDFDHLVGATLYTLTIRGGCRLRDRARLEFDLEHALVSGQALEGLQVHQARTGISALHQLHVLPARSAGTAAVFLGPHKSGQIAG